ncbi:coronin-1C-like [Stegodyphus dumicola]|uniref:coronin-1C-like n=1 Tax=Stegodyphus dumicola TaxID=202533 RepID=UPI0015A7FC17|nr:coronin-1C-like [Stegodyphus dumicola]
MTMYLFKSDLFQDDLYPDTLADIPAISAEEWIDGKDADPVLISLKEGYVPSKKQELKTISKSNILDNMPKKNSPTPQPSKQKLDELLEEVKKLKMTIQKHEVRILDLEKKFESRTGQMNLLKKAQTNNHGEKHLMPDEV